MQLLLQKLFILLTASFKKKKIQLHSFFYESLVHLYRNVYFLYILTHHATLD